MKVNAGPEEYFKLRKKYQPDFVEEEMTTFPNPNSSTEQTTLLNNKNKAKKDSSCCCCVV